MILCCGEALIDMLPRESAAGEACFAPHAGGAVFNTAIALGRLGAPAGFFCDLSNDMFGELLSDGLAASNVATDFAAKVDRPSTLAFVKLVDGQATYAFYDEGTALRMMAPAEMPTPGPGVTAMFFGGISLVGEPCGSAFEELMSRGAERCAIMLDPNIRPGFITDEPAFRARIDRMLAMADIVKLSDEDLHWIMGPGEVGALARQMLDRGPKVVCVTEGAQGARGITATGEVRAPAVKVAVADTVGAGDTFNAGVLAALHAAGVLEKPALTNLDDRILTEALTLGVHAAAVTVSRAGANPPWARELAP